jgi:hypothetical protein
VPLNCNIIPNSQINSAGTSCVCSRAGFGIEAINITTLVACLASPASSCPSANPIAARNGTGLVRCYSAGSSCPADLPFPLWGGVPNAIQECRLTPANCAALDPWNVGMFSSTGGLIGCIRGADGLCPFVAYRDGTSTPTAWALRECRQTAVCPASGAFSVPARSTNGTLSACLTLATTQACPDTAAATFTIEVASSSPAGCGSAGAVCITTTTTECLAPGSVCPASSPLALYTYSGNVNAMPQLTGCRASRTACDLTQAGMTPTGSGADPNANPYGIRVSGSSGLLGCIRAGANACPSVAPFATRSGATLTDCSASGTVINSCSNGADIVEVTTATGQIVECLPVTTPCPDAYPVTVRAAAGNPRRCLPAGMTCPQDSPYPFFAQVTAGSAPSLTNCWPNGSVWQCTSTISTGPTSTTGAYGIPLVGAAGVAAPVGCMLNGATACPPQYPFTFMQGSTLRQCRAALEGACLLETQYVVPLRDQGTVAGCALAGACPAAYPVIAGIFGGATSECLTTRTECASTQGFSFTLAASGAISRCIPPSAALDCSSLAISGFTGVALRNDLGVLIGCMPSAETSCPAALGFTFSFTSAAGAPIDCRRSFAAGTACPAAFPLPVLDAIGQRTGCTADTTCTGDGLVVQSVTATSAALQCARVTNNACPAGTYSFPLYNGNLAAGGAKLVRCIQPATPAPANCDGVTGFVVEVRSAADGTGLAGCAAATATMCPSTAPFFYLAADGSLAECRPAPSPLAASATCAPTGAFSSYTVEMYGEPASAYTTLVGCMAATASRCPTTPSQVYNYPFFLLGDGRVVEECRAAAYAPASNCAAVFTNYRGVVGNTFGIDAVDSINLAALTGTIIGCVKASAGCSTATGYPIALVNPAGALVQCRPTAVSACGGSYSLPLRNAAGTALEGCADAATTSCPNSWGFSFWKQNSVATPTAALSACSARAFSASPAADCTSTASFPLPVIDTVSGTLRGCLESATRCPAAFPLFTIGATNAVVSCASAGASFCSTGIRMTSSALGTLVGCSTGTACPSSAFANGVPSTDVFTQYTLAANGITVTRCAAGVSACAAGEVDLFDPAAAGGAGAVVGCMDAAATACPPSGAYVAFNARAAYAAVNPGTNGAAALRRCVAGAVACNTGPLATYTVPIYSTVLAAAQTLVGCKTPTASCPTSSPIMALDAPAAGGQSAIAACYALGDSNAPPWGCGGGTYTRPVCSAAPSTYVAASGCVAAALRGCLAATAPRCPTAAAFDGGQLYNFVMYDVTTPVLLACFTQPANPVGAACPSTGPTRQAIVSASGATGACTVSVDANACTTWWRTYTGLAANFCNA